MLDIVVVQPASTTTPTTVTHFMRATRARVAPEDTPDTQGGYATNALEAR